MTTTAYAQAAALAEHYERRDLPWRSQDTPPDLQVLVEGLLARTRAEAVASRFEAVFDGVLTAEAWLELPPEERRGRVAVLGLPAQKLRAVDGLAEGLVARTGLEPDGYIRSMAVLRLGGPAIPIDTNVERVAGRLEVDPEEWIGDLVTAAGFYEEAEPPVPNVPPPAYRVVCGVLDVGGDCRRDQCKSCPLAVWCSRGGRKPLGRSRLSLVRSLVGQVGVTALADLLGVGGDEVALWVEAEPPREYVQTLCDVRTHLRTVASRRKRGEEVPLWH